MCVLVYVCPQHTREEHRQGDTQQLACSTMQVLGIELGTAFVMRAYLQVEKTPLIPGPMPAVLNGLGKPNRVWSA